MLGTFGLELVLQYEEGQAGREEASYMATHRTVTLEEEEVVGGMCTTHVHVHHYLGQAA